MAAVEVPDPRREEAPDPRFTLANERTFLAWNRTALALIGGGLAVEQFLHTGRTTRLALAIPLIVLGAALAATSYSRWRRNEAAMWRGDALPPSRMPLIVAASFAMLSLGALVLAVVHAL
jgi:putative membrane protein